MKKVVLLAIFLLLLAFLLFGWEKTKVLTLEVKGIDLLEIDSGAGFLKVEGVPDLSQIEVTAEIIVRGMRQDKAERFCQERLVLKLEKWGHRARLVGKFKAHFSLFNWGEKFCHLTVRVPQEINLSIDDSSGPITVSHIKGNLNLDDSSGAILVSDIAGEVVIEDNSGDLKVTHIQGPVIIDDGSGDIFLKDITGQVQIDDGSGEIRVAQVKGKVIISDGSGSIWVKEVDQDVIIQEAGSGQIYLAKIKGRIIK